MENTIHNFIGTYTCNCIITYEGVLITLSPTYFPMSQDGIDIVIGKGGSVHVPNCKSFLVTEAERKHVT